MADELTEEDLAQPLDPDKLYYDATPTIEACVEKVRQLENRIVGLEKLLALQSSINGQLIGGMEHALNRVTEIEEGVPRSSIILPPALDS
jgi:hypothetical protein